MTNYNKRLDKILMAYKRYPYGTSAAPHISGYEAKQALTSLYKELVAEAKPKYKRPEDALVRSDMYEWMGYNKAIKEFEQNLLKALEEN